MKQNILLGLAGALAVLAIALLNPNTRARYKRVSQTRHQLAHQAAVAKGEDREV